MPNLVSAPPLFEQMEDPEDVWLRPLDLRVLQPSLFRRIWEVVQSIFTIFAFGVGIYAIFFTDLRTRNPLAYWYIIGTLSAELLALVFSGTMLGCFAMCTGDVGLAHAMALISVLHQVVIALCYYASMVVGLFVLTRPDFIASGEYDPIVIYIVVEVLIGLGYTISSLPSWLGLCTFLSDMCVRKVKHTPIVQFFGAGTRAQYVDYTPVEVYQDFVKNMTDPTIHEPFNVKRAMSQVPASPRGVPTSPSRRRTLEASRDDHEIDFTYNEADLYDTELP